MEDRRYQEEQINLCSKELLIKDRVLMQLPTGGGKTVEFCMIAQRYVRSSSKSVLILVHRQELMRQAAKTIQKVTGIKPHLITSKTNQWHLSRIYIGMVESTVKRLNLFNEIGLVIIDESHIANFNKIHNIFISEKILGFSATPISSSKKEPLNKYYQSIIVGPQIKELIKNGFLAQNITRCPKVVVDATRFEIDRRKGDYNEHQMAEEYKQSKHIINTVDYYFRFCFGKKTIIFNVNKEHSKAVNDALVFCGHNSRHLDSDSSDEERAEILEWYSVTDNAILCNVMIATVGFDEPTIINVILNFATLSLVKFIQCCGRGSRKIDGKDFFNIIDMGGNAIRFGDWSDDRDWEYIFNNPDQPGDGVAPVKTCPSCEGLVHAATRVCPLTNIDGEFCGYEFERKKEKDEQDLSEVVVITKGIDVEYLIKKNKNKYEYFTFMQMAEGVVRNMHEQNSEITEEIYEKYYNAYYNLCIDWFRKTLAGKDGIMLDISESLWHKKRARANFDIVNKAFK